MGHEIVFQFTPLREGRLRVWAEALLRRAISIHAPPRGATPMPMWFSSVSMNFNSRPSARGDEYGILPVSVYEKFQFTPLREGRPAGSRPAFCVPNGFQFTPLREGRRGEKAMSSLYNIISIHAPPRGATARRAAQSAAAHFNSRPSARGDRNISLRYYYIMSTDQPKKHCDTRQSRQSVL